MIGKIILHYKILEKLGEGGMGVVYKAEDTKLKRDVAIKFLPSRIAANDEERERFKIEAQAAAALNHPNIATIHAIEEHDDEMFIVMEYIEGRELQDIIDEIPLNPPLVNREAKLFPPLAKGGQGGFLSIETIVNYATQIAEGLQAAHKKGIVHRDIKSSNIMITDEGKIKIMDFGLARIGGGAQLTKDHSTVGTAAYMSPEQARGEPVDHRTDIWSFGVVMYELLTGQRPFHGDYEQAVIYSILNEEPAKIEELRPDIPKWIAHMVGKSMAKNAEARYQNMEEVLADLKKDDDSLPRRETPGKKTNYKTRRFHVGWMLAASVFLLVLFAVFAFWIDSGESGTDTPTYRSIAVLPFSDLSPNKDQEYFCDGMTEEILTKLAHLRDLKVIARTSVMRYKETEKSAKQIGDELNVETILEGSVRKAGDNIRVTAQLIKTKDESHIWANNYDRKLENIFSLQDDVAREIADALHLQLTPQGLNSLEKGPQENLSAYDLVMQGRYQRDELNFDQAMTLFDQALAIDSTFVLAYVNKAWAWHLRWVLSGFQNKEALRHKKLLAEKAIALAPDDPEAIAMLASAYLTWDEDNDKVYHALKRALAENANSIWTVETAAFFCSIRLGAIEQGVRYFYEKIERDPYVEIPYVLAAEHLISLGEYKKAESLVAKLHRFAPDFFGYLAPAAEIAIHYGDLKKADSLISRLEKINTNMATDARAHLLAARGQRESALELYQDEDVYMRLSMEDKALAYLENEAARHPIRSYYQYLTRYPLLKPLHDDPRFIKLVEKEKQKLEENIQKYGDIFLSNESQSIPDS